MNTNQPLTLTYRQLQELVKQSQVGIVTTKVKLNSTFDVLAAQYSLLNGGVTVVKATTKTETKKAAKAVVDGTPTYRELQQLLKDLGTQCTVKRNSKYEILLAELNRIQSSAPATVVETVIDDREVIKSSVKAHAKTRGFCENEAENLGNMAASGNPKQVARVLRTIN